MLLRRFAVGHLCSSSVERSTHVVFASRLHNFRRQSTARWASTSVAPPVQASSRFSTPPRRQTAVVDVEQRVDAVVAKVREQFKDERARLFAIVYINGRQFKVTQDDIIHLHHNLPIDVGDRLRLEKVLAVGGRDFTLFGRPLLPPRSVTVAATVIEKTTTAPELFYFMVNSKNITKMSWLSKELSVLRINEIVVGDAVFDANMPTFSY